MKRVQGPITRLQSRIQDPVQCYLLLSIRKGEGKKCQLESDEEAIEIERHTILPGRKRIGPQESKWLKGKAMCNRSQETLKGDKEQMLRTAVNVEWSEGEEVLYSPVHKINKYVKQATTTKREIPSSKNTVCV